MESTSRPLFFPPPQTVSRQSEKYTRRLFFGGFRRLDLRPGESGSNTPGKFHLLEDCPQLLPVSCFRTPRGRVLWVGV